MFAIFLNRRNYFLNMCLFILLITFSTSFAHGNKRGNASVKVGDKSISIDYGRPVWGKTDRLAQAPAGFVWRMGKDKATHLKTDVRLVFGEYVIPAGTYSLFMRHVGGEKWELIVNEQTGQWGTNYDKKRDLFAIAMKMKKTEKAVEKMTIELAVNEAGKGKFGLLWGPYVIAAKFKVAGK